MLGSRVGDRFIVEAGLSEGELVVTRGAFKLDSELQLKARPSMMNPDAGLAEIPAAEAEPGLLGQWGAVPRALERLRLAATADDPEASAAALATVRAAVGRVNTEAFHAKTASAWREFSNRLEIAMARASRHLPNNPELAYRDARHAVEEAGKHLGLPYQPAATQLMSPEALAQIKGAVAAYLVLSEALAVDDEKAALAALPALVNQLGDAGMGLASAKDIAAIREALRPMSDTLIAQIRAGAIDRLGNLYVVHCPMVKDYQGGDWLSAEPRVRNPYFGAEMLECGVVKENLSFESSHLTP